VKARRCVAEAAAYGVSPLVSGYIQGQRRRLGAEAKALDAAMRARFSPYFSRETLDGVRVHVGADLGLPQFPLAGAARRLGFGFPDPGLIAGIALGDVIAVRTEGLAPWVMFHELVHVVQYGALGIGTFARLYVRGFLEHGEYERIPLERCAASLEARFAGEGSPFSVERAVRRWMERDLF
jgi:hypothetical protein